MEGRADRVKHLSTKANITVWNHPYRAWLTEGQEFVEFNQIRGCPDHAARRSIRNCSADGGIVSCVMMSE